MCLWHAVRIKSEEDIICYKLFYKRDSNNILYSLYRRSVYELNHIKNTRAENPQIYCSEFLGVKTYHIEGSALHSFANYEDAKKYKKECKYHKAIIVKCIIPKNSKYIYEGVFSDVKSYASQKLKPIEIIQENNESDTNLY